MSNSIVFGSQVQIFFASDSKDFSQRICEVSSFSSKADDIVKKNSSLGETGVGSIDVLHDGGTMSFEAKKTDTRLASFFQAQDEHHRGGNELGKRGKTPYFTIVEKITYTDDSTEEVAYEGVVLHNPDNSVAGKNDEYVQKFEGTYKRRSIRVSGTEAGAKTTAGLLDFANALLNFASNKAPQSPSFSEVTPANYFKALGIGS